MTTSGAVRSLLWIDDDGPERFPYEAIVLAEKGWEIQWAKTGKEAVEALSSQEFDAIILDQMLPWIRRISASREPVWAGCLLLAWLRGHDRPSLAPQLPGFEQLPNFQPLEANRAKPVVLVSAYHDLEVEDALRLIQPDLQQFVKPIDADDLVSALP
jgi:CheY-like chemotaxis protein